jgi:hypothetical protein
MNRLQATLLAILTALSLLWLTLGQRPWSPVADEVEFLSTGWNILHRGVFSMSRPEIVPPTPTAYREPMFPLFLAGMTALVPSLRDAPPTCFFHDPEPDCKPLYGALRTANSLFITGSALLVFALARGLGATPVQALTTFALLAFNFEAAKWRSQILSDYMAMTLVALVCLGALALARRPTVLRAAATGLAIAALVLTKAIFLYALPLAAAAAVIGLARKRGRHAFAALAFFLAAGIPTAAWMVRTDAAVGSPAITTGRAGIALQARLIYDEATPQELAAMFVWYVRASGNGWARALFPESATARLTIDNPEGFAIRGHELFPERVAALAKTGVSTEAAERQVERELLRGLAANLPWHLLVSLPLAYRGLFLDEFLVLTLPALCVFAWGAARRRDGTILAVLALPIFAIAIHSFITINITRYQTPGLIALALAGGFVLPGWTTSLWTRVRRRS